MSSFTMQIKSSTNNNKSRVKKKFVFSFTGFQAQQSVLCTYIDVIT